MAVVLEIGIGVTSMQRMTPFDPDARGALGDGATVAKLREVTARIVAALAPERVLLFGSYAWGSPDANSDLDLYIVVSDRSEPSYRVARRGYLALRGTKAAVDLVVRTRSESERNARFVSTLDHDVLKRGVPLYG